MNVANQIRPPPRVSVVTPAYNAAPYLTQAIDSMLGQTFTDLEMIVVDDASTDRTPDILAAYRDPRLRVIRNDRNLGVVGSRNRGMRLARGEFIAPFDADDVSLPTRLAKQIAHLDNHPGIVLLGTATRYLEAGELRPGKSVFDTSPVVLRWLMHVSNPLGHSTLLYRSSAVRALGELMLEGHLAEDFDYCHRLLAQGDLGFLNEPLVLYRRHAAAVSMQQEEVMQADAVEVLERAYRPWFGTGAGAAAAMVNALLFRRRAPADMAALATLGDILQQLLDGFLVSYPVSGRERSAIIAHAGTLWLGVVRTAVRAGHREALRQPAPAFAAGLKLPTVDAAVSTLSGQMPFKRVLLPRLRRLVSGRAHPAPKVPATTLDGVRYEPAVPDMDRPPTLFVVVDCEAEFDWSKPFDRAQMAVTALQSVERGQAVFEQYGLRPIYVTDYAVVSQPEGYLPLRAIHERGACALGAHLHPWITPPLTEDVTVFNSYAGNLPEALEREKLQTLITAFAEAFGFQPRFFKAGRYGVGPNTMALLAEAGIRVDFSVIPGRDLSATGGPDFRAFNSATRLAADGKILCMPMTREPVGPLAQSQVLAGLIDGPGRAVSLCGVMSRLHLKETVTLTPEGQSTKQQIALIRSMLARSQRQFVLHYHSPSLAPGFTPYGTTAGQTDAIVRGLETVCRYFFDTVGGMPGNPNDLLPMGERNVPARLASLV